jgi:acetyl-CoA synthetase
MRLHKRQLEFTNVAVQLLEAGLQGNRYALAHVDSLGVIEHLRFADVAREAARWSETLREHGVQPGDRVVVLAGRDREWRCALLGVLQAGGVAVPRWAPTPVAELRAIAAHAGAGLFVSARARPDLVELDGTSVLSTDELDPRDSARAAAQLPHKARPGDVALILYERDAAGLRGAMHTHASLLAQANASEHWLGVREGERVWCTAAEGSVASIWILLAAWREGAEIVVVDQALYPEAQFELLDRFHPAAVWFSDDEYAVLASAAVPAWVELGPIRRALASDERADGATAFQHAFGAKVAPVYGSKETGAVAGCPFGVEREVAPGTGLPLRGIQLAIVDEQGNELPLGRVGDVAIRGDAPSLFAGYNGNRSGVPRPNEWFRIGGRGAMDAGGNLQLAFRTPLEIDQVEADADISVAAPVDEDAPPAVDVAAPDQLPTIDERLASAVAASDEPEAPSRRGAREAKRARRREEEQANERRKLEERRRREEAKSRELAERAAKKERLRVEETERAEREAAHAEERRRTEDEKRREEERWRDAAEQTERQRLVAAKATARRAKEKRQRDEEHRPEAESRHQAAEQAERERLAPDILSRISEYGMTAPRVDPDTRRDPEESSERAGAVDRDERRGTE